MNTADRPLPALAGRGSARHEGPPLPPEDDARQVIDRQLQQCGWVVQDYEDSEDLPEPDVLAQEIADDLQTALEQFSSIAAELRE